MSVLESRVSQVDVKLRAQCHDAVSVVLAAWPHARLDAGCRGFPSGGGDGSRSSEVPDPTSAAALRGVDGAHVIEPEVAAAAWLPELFDVAVAWLGKAPHEPTDPTTPPRWHAAVDAWCDDWPARSAERAEWFLPVDRLLRLANRARVWWPAVPKRGERVAGVTVGERGNDVKVCALCEEPIGGGHDDPAKVMDDQPYHLRSVGRLGEAGYRPACFYLVWRQRRRSNG